MENYEKCLINNDKPLAIELTAYIGNFSIIGYWKEICLELGYHYPQAFDESGNMTSHFRRVINEIKFVSLYGKHTWTSWYSRRDII